MKALAASTLADFALTIAPQPPRKVDGLPNDCLTWAVVKPGLLSAVRKSLPAAHRMGPRSEPPPNDGVTPASLPMNRPFWSLVLSAFDASISSSMVVGGFTPALSR